MQKSNESQKIILTFKQVQEAAKEYEELGKEGFLVKHKAIKVVDGEWRVLRVDGLKGLQAMYGFYYPSDTPYAFWQEIVRQVEFFLMRKEEKEKAQNAGLEATAQTI